jgi:hypothetical protein
MNQISALWLLCVGPAKRRSIRVCLDFFAPLFLSRKKVEKPLLRQQVNNQSTFLTLPDPEIFCLTAALPLY